MADRLTDAQMLKLVEIYRDYECLWNVTSTFYKNRHVRESAYKNILDRLNIPGLSVRDIPKKIKNLRSSYYQELKRIRKSIRSGAAEDSVYKPKVSWFTTADSFLKAFRNIHRTFLNIDENSHSISDNDSETQNTKSTENFSEENSNAADDNFDDSNTAGLPTYTVKIEPNEISSVFIAPSRKPMRKRRMGKKDEEIHEAIAKIVKIANSVTNSTTSLEKEDDEFDNFGKYVATTLRSLPKKLAIVGKTDIQKVLSEMQLQALEENTQPTLLSYGDSTSNVYDQPNQGNYSSTSESDSSH